MQTRILVAYASRAGSTRGVAEAIGAALAEGETAVDVLPVEAVGSVAGYDAAVLGSAVQGGAPLPEALAFAAQHSEALGRIPCAAFLVCMTLAMPRGNEYRSHVSGWLAPLRAHLRPVSEGLFAGALDFGKIPSAADRLKFRLSVLLGVWKAGDRRNWAAIKAWSLDLIPLLIQQGM